MKSSHPVRMTWAQYRRRECWHVGRIVRLGPLETEIVATLLMRREFVKTNDLIECCWPDPDLEPVWAQRSLSAMISRLYKKLPGAIANQRGWGYRIIKTSELRRAA